MKVASGRHTAVLVAALLATAVSAAVADGIAEWPRTLAAPGARRDLYLRILALQWAWVVYVWFGVRRAEGGLWSLIDTGPGTVRRWMRHVAIGLAGLALWLAFGAVLGAVLRPTAEQLRGLQSMLPHTSGERLLWVAFALSAAVCEEIVYRGYLLRQFTAFTGTAWLSLLLQAAMYACAHLALPLAMVVPVALLGVLLGAVALWQRSLVPAMILHAGTGLVALAGSWAPR